MAEESGLSEAELRRQVRQHLDSLRAAGVEWLPAAPNLVPAPQPVAPAPASARRPAVTPPPAPSPQPVVIQSALPFENAEPAALTPEQRRHELTVLATTVAGCRRCPELASTRSRTVFGVGPLDVELCFVGEAPGADEDRQGEPFVGPAGQLLNRIIAACGLKREEVYICNILKCRPPGNRTPLPNEAHNCHEYLARQLELVRPRFLCALGGTAAKYLLDTELSIGRLRGRFYDYHGIPVLCTYHPSFLLPHRSPEKKKDVWEDMKKLLARMGRPVPGK